MMTGAETCYFNCNNVENLGRLAVSVVLLFEEGVHARHLAGILTLVMSS